MRFGRAASGHDRGFSLTEALIAVCLLLVVVAAALAMALPGLDRAYAQPASADAQQRARVAVDALVMDLKAGGAGLESGPWAGGLSHYLPPLVPRRLGAVEPDGPAVARQDAVAVISTAPGWRQARLLEPLGPDGILVTADEPSCPDGVPVCGLVPGATILVFDEAGRFGFFSLDAVGATAGLVQPLQIPAGGPFPAGSAVADVSVRTYHFDQDARELRRYDGRTTDVPLVDDVVGVVFRYFGDNVPPTRPKPPVGTANCLYDAAGNSVGGLSTLPGPAEGLVELPLSMFSDGPWCGSGPTAYDVDLLRVRQVHAALRVQAAPAAVRAAGAAYVNAGWSRSARRNVPDFGLSITVAPRHLVARR